MKRAIAAVVLLMNVALAFAARQETSTVKGTVTDKSTGEPAAFATIALMSMDSTMVAGATADINGAYELKTVAGNYMLNIYLVGYKDASVQVKVAGYQTSVENIALDPDTEMLKGAVVTEKIPLVEMKVDKLVMNVSQSAFAQGSNALELMKKAPGVTIDKDGNVQLNGKTVSVWIDGRPSYLDGKSLEALLRSTDGTTIDKFEIMEHPSSKYDAAGQGGIINIKTKKNMLSGLNGSVGLTAGGMYFDKESGFIGQGSASANLAYRTKKNNTFLNLYGAYTGMDMEFSNDVVQNISGQKYEMNSSSLQNIDAKSYNLKFGNDWFKDDKNTFGFIFTMPVSTTSMGSGRAFNKAENLVNGASVLKSESETSNEDKTNQVTGNLNWTHVFDPAKASEITANLDWYHSMTPSDNSQSTYNQLAGSSTWDEVSRIVTSDNLVNIYSAKADYQSVIFGKAMMEAGAKWAMTDTDYDTDRTETGAPASNTKFTYREHIGAAYASAAMMINPKLSAKAGLRAEYTNSYGDWISLNTHTSRSYLNVFPTVFVGYNPSQNWRFSGSYTRRINRPSYFSLNPAEQLVDAHTTIVGNPDLQPEYTSDFAFTTGYGQHLNLALIYDHVNNLIVQTPSFESNGDEIMSWNNFGHSNRYIASFSVSALPLTKWLSWTVSANGFYFTNQTKDTGYNNNGLTAQLYTCFSAVLPHEWKAELDGNYMSSAAVGYFKTEPCWMANFGVKKDILDHKLTLSFNVNDILRSFSTTINTETENGSTSHICQKYKNQSVTVGVHWNFGKAQQTKARKVGNLEESSRAGQSTKIGTN